MLCSADENFPLDSGARFIDVSLWLWDVRYNYHRDTENTEVAQSEFKLGHYPTKRPLEKTAYEVQTATMTNKEIVQDLLRRIPDDASLQDIARELEFIAAVRQGLSELDNGDSIPIEEVEQELPSWIIR